MRIYLTISVLTVRVIFMSRQNLPQDTIEGHNSGDKLDFDLRSGNDIPLVNVCYEKT